MPNERYYPCPCCGHGVFVRQPGGHERCPICRREDDLAQLRFPRMPGSANHVSFEQARHNYADFGAAERREPGWRPLDPERDKFAGGGSGQRSRRRWPRSGEPRGWGEHNIEEPQRGIDYGDSHPPADTTVPYYWRATCWRRLAS